MLSADRQSSWVHLIVENLLKKEMVQYKDKDLLVRAAGRAMSSFIKEHDRIEEKVRQKISSLKRNVSETSSEWELLYSKYYEDELSRSHLSRS